MKQGILLIFTALLLSNTLFGQTTYYWVNNNGSWDELSHWSATSGDLNDTLSTLPTSLDNVVFDENSFTGSDTSFIVSFGSGVSTAQCKTMDWSAITKKVTLNSAEDDTLKVYGNLILSNLVSFNFKGLLNFVGENCNINVLQKTLSCNVKIDADSVKLYSNLLLPTKNLYLSQGILDATGHNVSCKNLNTDTTNALSLKNSIDVTNAKWNASINDTLSIHGSIALSDNINFNFTGPIYFNFNGFDTLYHINFYNHDLNNDLKFNGNKKMNLWSNLNTTKNIYFESGFEFNSNNNDITTSTFLINSAFAKKINLGNSIITITGSDSSFQINDFNTTLNSSNASIIYTYDGPNPLSINFGRNSTFSFKSITFAKCSNYIYTSLNVDQLDFPTNANLYLKNSISITANDIVTNGTCREYTKISSFCENAPYSDLFDCERETTSLILNNPDTILYANIQNITATNLAAKNSQDKGYNNGISFIPDNSTDTIYWVGNTGKWNDPDNWSPQSGIAMNTCLPSNNDVVIFDASSFADNDTIYIDNIAYCGTIDFSNIDENACMFGNEKLILNHNIYLNQKLKIELDSNIYWVKGNHTKDSIKSNNATINTDITIETGTLKSLTDDLTTNNNIYIENNLSNNDFDNNGFNISGKKLVTKSLFANGNLNYSNAEIMLTGSGNVLLLNNTKTDGNSEIELFSNDGKTSIIEKAQYIPRLILSSPSTKTQTSISSDYLQMNEGISLEIAPGNTLTIDSLFSNGSCGNPVYIGAYRESNENAKILKSGYDTLKIENAVIQNLIAKDSTTILYLATNSDSIGTCTGWTFNNSNAGKTYYWKPSTDSDWADPNNWSLTFGGTAGSCIPGPKDTVIFKGNVAKVIVQRSAACKMMKWEDITSEPELVLNNDLQIFGDLILNENLSIVYSDNIKQTDANTPKLYLSPRYGNTEFNPISKKISVNTTILGHSLTDTLYLSNDLVLDTLSTLTLTSGTFDTKEHDISCGIIASSSKSNKTFIFKYSNLNIKYNLSLNDIFLTINSDSSQITMESNKSMECTFDGGGKEYFNVNFFSTPSNSTDIFYGYNILGNNTFNKLYLEKSAILSLEQSSKQTINDSIIFVGNCTDTCAIYAEGNAKIECDIDKAKIKHVGFYNIEGNNFSVDFCENNGGNSNITFNDEKPITPAFNAPEITCFGSEITFNNTSTNAEGTTNGLTYEWILGDGDTTDVFSPNHTYDFPQKFIVQLNVTDTNNCAASVIDTIIVYKPNITLNASVSDYEICENDEITFSAESSDTSKSIKFHLFNNGVDNIVPPDLDTLKLTLNNISNNDSIYAVQNFKGCEVISNGYKFTIKSKPNISLISNDTEICRDETINLTASGADKYELYLNGSQYSSLDTNHNWTFDALNNNDKFSISGIDTITQCTSSINDAITIIVNELPSVTLTSSDADNVICLNDTITFTANNATKYRFFKNETNLGEFTENTTASLSNIENGDVIRVEGINDKSCTNMSNSIIFTVNPKPILSFSSNDNDSRICLGSTVDFVSNGAEEFRFFDNETAGTFSNSNSYTLNPTTVSTHNIKVEGKLGDCYAFADTVFQIDVKPTISLINSNLEICAYDSVRLEASGDVQYQFFVDNAAVTEMGTNNIYEAFNLISGQILTVTGTDGACVPDPISVTVNEIPNITMFCSDADTTICDGDIITFTAVGAETYSFFTDGVLQGTPSTINTFKPNAITNNQTISVEGKTNKGCISTSSNVFNVRVFNHPTVTLTQNDDDLTICKGDTIRLIANGADNYEFFNTGNSLGEASNNNILDCSTINNNDNIYVIGSNEYCSSTSDNSFTYTVNPIPTITLNSATPLSLCKGEEIKLNASGANQYQFYVDGNPIGTITTNNIFTTTTLNSGQTISVDGYLNSCYNVGNASYTYTINSYPELNFTANQVDNTICYGDSVVFYGTGAQNYTFYLDGVPVSTDSIYVNDELTENQTITLYGINGACGLYADTTMTMNVNFVNINLQTNSESTICEGDEIELTASGANLYEFFIDNISQGAASNDSTIVVDDMINGQIISVKGTSNGCTQEAFSNYYIHVLNRPEITSSGATSFCEGDSIMLISSSPLNNQWYINNTEIIGATNQNLWITTEGNYTVSVIEGNENKVSSIGDNQNGQFGDGTTFNSLLLSNALLDEEIKEVSCGNEYTLALTENGDVYAWGNNEFGNLGSGNYSNQNTPEQVGNLSNITKIDAGYQFALALKNDSTLYSWGENTSGQLGNGSNSTTNFPFAINGLENVIDMAAGKNHALALTADGNVWAWGNNQYGQLGDSTLINKKAPVKVHELSNIVKIAAGDNHSLAIDNNGKMYVWGANGQGQLGTGSINSAIEPTSPILNKKVVDCAAGAAHTVTIDTYGKINAWGDNTYGQLGVENITNTLYPIKSEFSGNIVEVKTAPYSTLGLRADGNILACGFNTSGQLGNQNVENIFTPTIIDQVMTAKSFDAGTNHIAIVQAATNSCQSEIETINIDTVPQIIILAEDYTLSTPIQGTSYQWYFNGNPIPNANSNTVTISAWGTYYVAIEFENGCYGYSDGYNYQVGIKDFNAQTDFTIYPNPNSGKFAFNINANPQILSNIYSWTIYDSFGRIIAENNNFTASSINNIELTNAEAGIYSLRIICNDGNAFTKNFVIER